jgi:DNA end-binding protein Ku
VAAEYDEMEDQEQGAGLRSFWTGTITFGLVTVPVTLFAANRPRGVALKMTDEEGTPIARRYVCAKDGKDLTADDIVRGYEIEKGKFVVVTDEELEAIEPRKSREIDLRLFVDENEIDPMYFERAYFLVPTGGTNKAYRLLAEVMERTKRAAVATFVMRAKEYLVAILAENGILRAETLRFHDEIRKPEDVGLPEKVKPKPASVKKFEEAIARRSGKVDFSEFLDEGAQRLEKLVEKKRRAGEGLVQASAESTRDEDEGGEVVDLLAVLTRSLQGSGSSGGTKQAAKKAPARKAPARKVPARKKAPAKKGSAKKRTTTAAKKKKSA